MAIALAEAPERMTRTAMKKRAREERRARESVEAAEEAAAAKRQKLRVIRFKLIGEPGIEASGLVCSFPWSDVVITAMDRGDIPAVRQPGRIYRAMMDAGVYPPGGRDSLMRTCPDCGRDCPPSNKDAVDLDGRTNGLCYDCIELRKAPRDYPPRVTLGPAGLRPAIKLERVADADGKRHLYGAVCDGVPVEPVEEEELVEESESLATQVLEELRARDAVIEECPLATETVPGLKLMIRRHLQTQTR